MLASQRMLKGVVSCVPSVGYLMRSTNNVGSS